MGVVYSFQSLADVAAFLDLRADDAMQRAASHKAAGFTVASESCRAVSYELQRVAGIMRASKIEVGTAPTSKFQPARWISGTPIEDPPA